MATVHHALVSPRGAIPSYQDETKVAEVEENWKARLEEQTTLLKKENLDLARRAEVLQERGALLLKRENFSAACIDFQEALGIISNPEVRITRAWYKRAALYKLLASASEKQKKYKEAWQYYQEGWKTGIRDGKEEYNPFLTVEYAKFLLKCRKDREKYQDLWETCSPPEYAQFLKDVGPSLPSPVDICTQTLESCPAAVDVGRTLLYSLRYEATQASDDRVAQKYWKTLGSSAISCAKMSTTESSQIEIRKFLAESYLVSHQCREALKVLEEAISLDPSPKNIVELSILRLEVRITEEFPYDDGRMLTHALRLVEKKTKTALNLFKEVERLYFHRLKPSEQIEALLGTARAYYYLNQKSPDKYHFKLARASLEKAKQFLEEKTIPPARKGDIFHIHFLLSLQENPSAEVDEFFQEAMKIYPAHGPFLFDIIQLWIERDRLEEASSLLEKKYGETFLTEENGTYLQARLSLARAKKEKSEERWDQAKLACTKGLRFAKDDVRSIELYDLLAEVHLQGEEIQEAYRCKLQAYQLDPSPLRSLKRFEELKTLDSRIEEREAAAPKEIPQKSKDQILQMAIHWIEKDPEEALQVFDHILQTNSEFSYLERFRFLMWRGRAFSAISSGESQFNQAQSLLREKPEALSELPPEEKAAVFLSLARIYVKKGEPEAAFAQFEEAWSFCKTDKNLLFDYVRFLIDRQELEKAKEVLNEAKEKINLYDVQLMEAEYLLACGKLTKVKDLCEAICARTSFVTFYSPLAYLVVEAHSYAAKACIGMERFFLAVGHAQGACKYTKSDDYLYHFQKYEKALRAHIEERHLEELMKGAENLTLAEKIEYFSHLLAFYEKELMTHVTQHMNLLLMRAYCYAQLKKFKEAFEDCDAVRQILRFHEGRIREETFRKVFTQVVTQIQSFANRNLPKNLYQIPLDRILFSK